MSSRPVIYSLVDPRTGATRYIGKADDVEIRLCRHLQEAKREQHHRARWIRSLVAVGLEPQIVPLFSVVVGDWQSWEIHFIAEARAAGLPLTNATSGGDGALDLTPEARERHRASLKTFYATPEARARMSAQAKAAMARPDIKAKCAAAAKAAMARPEVKAKHAAASARPDVRAKRATAIKAAMARPDVRAKVAAAMKAAHARPEARARMSAASKAALARPEVKAKNVAAWARPDVRAKRSAGISAGHRRRSRGCLAGQMSLPF